MSMAASESDFTSQHPSIHILHRKSVILDLDVVLLSPNSVPIQPTITSISLLVQYVMLLD